MSWHSVCKIDELPPTGDGGKEFVVAGHVLAVFRCADGQLRAIDGMCAHQGGPLAQGKLDDRCLTCPWHGWQYDITTGQNLLTHKKMLETYSLKICDGQVWIELEQE